jgi:hypothetical protein
MKKKTAKKKEKKDLYPPRTQQWLEIPLESPPQGDKMYTLVISQFLEPLFMQPPFFLLAIYNQK